MALKLSARLVFFGADFWLQRLAQAAIATIRWLFYCLHITLSQCSTAVQDHEEDKCVVLYFCHGSFWVDVTTVLPIIFGMCMSVSKSMGKCDITVEKSCRGENLL